MIGNMWLKKSCIHKYMWVSRVRGQWALINYMLFNRCEKESLLDMNVPRGAGGGFFLPFPGSESESWW